VLVALALLVSGVAVSLASAHGPMGGTEVTSIDVPANGSEIVTRSPMPSSSTSAYIGVTAPDSPSTIFDSLTQTLSSKPSFGQRAIVCVLIYSQLRHYGETENKSYSVTEPTLQDLFLNVCIELALSLPETPSAAHEAGRAATAKCGIADRAVHVTITRSGSGYSATTSGPSYVAKPPGLRVACTRTATGLTITEKPRSRHGKLVKVTGPTVGLGFVNGSSSPGKLKVSLGVR